MGRDIWYKPGYRHEDANVRVCVPNGVEESHNERQAHGHAVRPVVRVIEQARRADIVDVKIDLPQIQLQHCVVNAWLSYARVYP